MAVGEPIFEDAKDEVVQSQEEGNDGGETLSLAEENIVPANQLELASGGDAFPVFDVKRKAFRQAVAFGLFNHFEPHCIVIVFLEVSDLDESDGGSVEHDRDGGKVAVSVHSPFADAKGTCPNHLAPHSFRFAA